MTSLDPVADGGRANSGYLHVQGLDGLRGIAAFAIFGHHLGLVRHQGGLFTHAYLAVDFFFLLSGFVIGLAYESKMESGLGFWSYARTRLIRLYPMIVAGVAVGGAVALMAGASYPIWLAALAQLAFVPFAFSRVEAYPLNGVQWSLFFELFINAVHAAAQRWLTTPRLAWIVALSGIWLVATDFQFGSLSVGYNPANFAGGFARVTFSFAAGLLIYRLSRSNRLGTLGIPYLAVAVLLTLALALPAAPWCRDWIFAVAIFPAILIMALGSRPPTRLTGFVVWAGAISYPLYAIHAPLLHLAATFAPRHADGLVRATYWPFIVVTILGAATAAERYYDRPLRRRLQGRKVVAASHSALSVAPPT